MSFKNLGDETPKWHLSNSGKSHDECKNGKMGNESIPNRNDHFMDGTMNNAGNYKSQTKEKDGNSMGNGMNQEKTNNRNKRDDRVPSFMDFLMYKMIADLENSDEDILKGICKNPQDSEKCKQCRLNPENNISSNPSPVHTESFEDFLKTLLGINDDPSEKNDDGSDTDKKDESTSAPEAATIDNQELVDIIKMQQNQIRSILIKLDVIMQRTEPTELETGYIEMEGLNYSSDEIQYAIKRQMKKLRRVMTERDEVINEKMDIIIRSINEMSANMPKTGGPCKCTPKDEKK